MTNTTIYEVRYIILNMPKCTAHMADKIRYIHIPGIPITLFIISLY